MADMHLTTEEQATLLTRLENVTLTFAFRDQVFINFAVL